MALHVLTIGESSPVGDLGIQSDLRIFSALGIHGMAAVTAVRASQGDRGDEVSLERVSQQVQRILAACSVEAIKVGPLPSGAVVRAAAEHLASVHAPIVLDWDVSGERAFSFDDEVGEALFEALVPRAVLLTTSIEAAEALLGLPVRERVDIRRAARTLAHQGASTVWIRGGTVDGVWMPDLIWEDGVDEWFELPSVNVGPGALLSAIATARLAGGDAARQAVGWARDYLFNMMGGSGRPGIGG